MKKTKIKIKKMDCPSEIQMIEGALNNEKKSIQMEYDLATRVVTFYHKIEIETILKTLRDISLPGELISTVEITKEDVPDKEASVELKTLKVLLVINLSMFFIEIIAGFFADSTGLLADGLDMLADAFVYGVSIYAVGKSSKIKNNAAMTSGFIQITLGLICLIEVVRKFFLGSEPLSAYMISISIVALLANSFCLMLIHKHKDGEVHMKASWIFSANDVVVNSGVILSGVLVYMFGSNIPDLVIGGLVSLIVIRGGFQILKITRLNKA